MTDRDTEMTTATFVTDSVHALRNEIATLRSAAQLIDDDEIADAVTTATAGLQVALERTAALARVEAADPDASAADIPLGELLALAQRRARREGADPCTMPDDASLTQTVHVFGARAERLLTDLLHVSSRIEAITGGALRCSFDEAPVAQLRGYLDRIARATGASLAWTDREVTLALPPATNQ